MENNSRPVSSQGPCEFQSRRPLQFVSLEFNSQRKLDLALVVRELSCHLACAGLYRFREWAQIRSITREYSCAQMIAAEVWMVHDVEELCAKLQQAGFSQK